MHWQPQANQQTRIARAHMLRAIRAFFYQHQVLEVETPALSQSANTDPFIESFQLTSGQSTRYLHTSPEYPMKRLLAAGSGDIYQICKVWRNEPSSSHHNAEFSMLEYYRLGFDLNALMHEVNTLLSSLLPHLSAPSDYLTYQSLFLDKLAINPHTIADDELQMRVTQAVPGLQGELDRQGALDLLLTHCIEPQLATDRLSFIYDYPASQSALAQTEYRPADQVQVAKRFEVYVGSLELGNGYQELTSAERNTQVLAQEQHSRQQQGLQQVPSDQRFLAAMHSGMPECAGIAIGIDRLLMLKTGANSLAEVLNFSWENA